MQVWSDAMGRYIVIGGGVYVPPCLLAVMVIVRVIPIALLAKKNEVMYNYKGEDSGMVVAHGEWQHILNERQLSWNARLIGKVGA